MSSFVASNNIALTALLLALDTGLGLTSAIPMSISMLLSSDSFREASITD